MQQNAVGWFDIYVNDMDRAVNFYQSIFKVDLQKLEDPTDSNVLMMSFPANMEKGERLLKERVLILELVELLYILALKIVWQSRIW